MAKQTPNTAAETRPAQVCLKYDPAHRSVESLHEQSGHRRGQRVLPAPFAHKVNKCRMRAGSSILGVRVLAGSPPVPIWCGKRRYPLCESFRGAKQTNAPWGITANERVERIFHAPNHHGPAFGLAPGYLLAQRARFP